VSLTLTLTLTVCVVQNRGEPPDVAAVLILQEIWGWLGLGSRLQLGSRLRLGLVLQ